MTSCTGVSNCRFVATIQRWRAHSSAMGGAPLSRAALAGLLYLIEWEDDFDDCRCASPQRGCKPYARVHPCGTAPVRAAHKQLHCSPALLPCICQFPADRPTPATPTSAHQSQQPQYHCRRHHHHCHPTRLPTTAAAATTTAVATTTTIRPPPVHAQRRSRPISRSNVGGTRGGCPPDRLAGRRLSGHW